MDTVHTDLSLEVVKELLEDKEHMTAAENMFENHPRIEDEELERDIRQRRDISLRRELQQEQEQEQEQEYNPFSYKRVAKNAFTWNSAKHA